MAYIYVIKETIDKLLEDHNWIKSADLGKDGKTIFNYFWID
jgi:hypothetical protein